MAGKPATALTLSQIGQIRGHAARKAGQLMRRLGENALEIGEFAPRPKKDKKGHIVYDDNNEPLLERHEMTIGQIKSAAEYLKHVLPMQQQTTIEDITQPSMTREEILHMYQDALKRLGAEDVRLILSAMPDGERLRALQGFNTERSINSETMVIEDIHARLGI